MMRSIPRRRRSPLLPAAVAALLLVLVLLVWLLRPVLSATLSAVLVPVLSARNALTAGESASLRAELASTTAALADRNALYAENLDLKQRLARNAGREVILAAVLQRPGGTPYDTMLVDAGARHGLLQGQLVAAAGTALIGRVSEVYNTTARVALFSSPGEAYTALLRGSIPVAMEGQGGGSLVGEVPSGTKARVGDPLILMGIGSGLVAEVSAVETHEGQSFETIYMRLPANPQELRFVEVWK